MRRHLGDPGPGEKERPGLGQRLLAQASSSDVRMDALLGRALEEALEVGGGEAGALFVFDPAEPERCTVAWASSGRTELPPRHRARQLMETGAERVSQLGRTGCSLRVRRGEREPDEPVLTPSSREALWVPLLDRGHLAGVLVLESLQAGSFSPARVRGLEALAERMLPGLQRGLLLQRLEKLGGPREILGLSPSFLELEREVRLAGCFSDGPVLITGERGSGKELVAWAIHAWSRRHERPFVPMLASVLSEGLVADELFGHERNAFTGAEVARAGKIQAADGGTVFLDEVSDLPVPVQTAFLRVLERGEVQRIGTDRPLQVNVRVVAATNSDLAALMASGRFRRDLHDRLAFFEVRVPPLRERREDIPLLASHFLQHFCRPSWRHSVYQRNGACEGCRRAHAPCVSEDFLEALQHYPWPGNVRELKHTMARIVATTPDEEIGVRHLPEEIRASCETPASSSPDRAMRRLPRSSSEPVQSLDEVIRAHIETVLAATGYNQSETARLLGLPLSTLRSKMKRMGIPLP